MKNDPYSHLEAILFLPSNNENQTIDPINYDLLGVTPIERTLRSLEKNGVGHVTFFIEDETDSLMAVLEDARPWGMGFSFVRKQRWQEAMESYRLLPPQRGLLVLKEPLVLDGQLVAKLMKLGESADGKILATSDQLLFYCPEVLLKQCASLPFFFDKNGFTPSLLVKYMHTSLFYRPIRTDNDVKLIEKHLVKNLTKPNDGWVSRHLNRPISTLFSRMLASTKVTPNQVTLALVVPSLLTGWVLAQGGYWGFLIGGAMFHLTSVLDGVDGELARLKFKSSLFGKWLDFMCDNLAYLAALAGYLVGLYRDGVSVFEKMASLTALALTLSMMTSIIIYYKRFNKDGKLLTVDYGFRHGRRLVDRLMQWGELLGKREWFALVFFLLAIIGKMEWALIYICLITGGVLAFSFDAHARAKRLGY